MKYIDTFKLKAWLKREADKEFKETEENANYPVLCHFHNGARLQALDTIDFIESIQQEQLEVDFNKELDSFYDSPLLEGETISFMSYTRIAQHFYKLGLNAKEEEE